MKVICEDCGAVFLGGQNAHFCPVCRRIRLSETAKKRNLNKIGNNAYPKQQAETKIECDDVIHWMPLPKPPEE